jgi:hypothetical protein
MGTDVLHRSARTTLGWLARARMDNDVVCREAAEVLRRDRVRHLVLAAIAGSLRLSVEEREHLYLLAGQPPPPRGDQPSDLDAGLVATMESLTAATIALIVDDLGTVLSQNRLSAEVFGDFAQQADYADNMVWQWFTNRAWRVSCAPTNTHDAITTALVADLRATAAQRGYDAATARLVGELRAASDEFARPPVGPARRVCPTAEVRTPASSAGRRVVPRMRHPPKSSAWPAAVPVSPGVGHPAVGRVATLARQSVAEPTGVRSA